MDEKIRNLTKIALETRNPSLLEEAHSKLKKSRQGSDHSNAMGYDIYIGLAEAALKIGKVHVAEDCVKMYFQTIPPANQFLCRAYYVQAMLSLMKENPTLDDYEKASGFMLKGIGFAKKHQRYYFLVFNGSVILWSLARPFFKPNYKQFLAKSLHQVVKALNEVDDKDYDWRAQLLIYLIECYVDGNKKEDATNLSNNALQFAKTYAVDYYKTIFEMQVKYRLFDSAKFSKDSKLPLEVTLLYKVFKLKGKVEINDKLDLDTELDKVLKACHLGDTELSPLKKMPSFTNVATTSSPIERSVLLVELARFCIQQHKPEAAVEAINSAKTFTTNQGLLLEMEFLNCELIVERLKEKREILSTTTVETTVKAISMMEELIMSATRMRRPGLIQVGCISLWNLCLPLLNDSVRRHVRKPLSLIADALETIDSLMLDVRCLVHMELAKAEEENDQIQTAIAHIKKSLALDEMGVYQRRLGTALQRLTMRATLYKVPERPEDVACMIIEQAKCSKDTGATDMKRASLTKAGLLLAPDAFQLVLDGEAVIASAKKNVVDYKDLADRVKQYEKSVKKISGHLRRVGGADDIERVQIWASLIKTARKDKLWDVTRAACRFCLLYDDGRFSLKNTDKTSKSSESQQTQHPDSSADLHEGESNLSLAQNKDNAGISSLEECDILRQLAEIRFIFAEANIQLLLHGGHKLLDKVKQVEPKTDSKKDGTSDEECTQSFNIYSEWIEKIGQQVVSDYHRTVNIGAEIRCDWIVCNAGIYLWNYTNHFLTAEDFKVLVPLYQPVYETFKSLGFSGEVLFACKFCCALAQGYMQPYLVNLGENKRHGSALKPQKGRSTPQINKGKGSNVPTIGEGDLSSDIKTAIEVLEFALNINTQFGRDTSVPLSVRYPLIKCWVLCKYLLGQALPKSLFQDDEHKNTSKALYGIESLSLQIKYGTEIFNWPSLQEVVKMVEHAKWEDRLIEIECWCHLAVFSYQQAMYSLVEKCTTKALNLQDSEGRTLKNLSAKAKREQELLHYAAITAGQSLVSNSDARVAVRMKALVYFRDSCCYARNALKYHLVMNAVRHFWNTCRPLMSQPYARKSLRKPIRDILDCMTHVFKETPDLKGGFDYSAMQLEVKNQGIQSTKLPIPEGNVSKIKDQIPNYEEDLQIRAGLYGLLFQTYIDENNWSAALREMDEAMSAMPRTPHRLLIVKYRILAKAKLGDTVQFDIGRFKDESEAVQAVNWLRVARNSSRKKDQLSAYQNAVMILESPQNQFQKVNYLMEFSEWLYSCDFPYQDVKDHLLMAADIMITRAKTSIPVEKTVSKTSSILSSHETYESDSDTFHPGRFVDTLTDMESLAALLLIYIKLTDISWAIDNEYESFITTAASVALRMLEMSIKLAERASAEGIKPGDKSPTRSPEKEKKGKEAKAEKIQKTCIPAFMHQWTSFQLSEKTKEYFENDNFGDYISKKSITKPATTFAHLDLLLDHLKRSKWIHLGLPVVQLMLIVSDIIEDKSYHMLSLLRNVTLCQDLKLLSPATLSLKEALNVFLDKDDKISIREYVAVQTEKYAQIPLDRSVKSRCNIERRFRSHTCYGIWIKIGEVLIDHAQYGLARDVFEQASFVSHGLVDEEQESIIRLNLAVISLQEGDIGKALSLTKQFKACEGDYHYWLKLILILSDAFLEFKQHRGSTKKHLADLGEQRARELITRALFNCEKIFNDRSHKVNQMWYFRAHLQQRLGNLALPTSPLNCTPHQGDQNLQEDIELIRMAITGFRQTSSVAEAALAMIQLSCKLKDVAYYAVGNERRQILLEALMTAKDAVEFVDQNLLEVEESCSAEELHAMCLPLQKVAVETRLNCIEILLNLSKQTDNEIQTKDDTGAGRSSAYKLIETFTGPATPLTDIDKRWHETLRLNLQEALSLVYTSLATSDKLPQLQAKIQLYAGRCFMQMARSVCPDGINVWNIDQVATEEQRNDPSQGLLKYLENMDELSPSPDLIQELEKIKLKHIRKAEKLKSQGDRWKCYLAEAIECFLQGLKVALHYRDNRKVSEITFELLECIGSTDPAISTQLLALYQSACTFEYAERIIGQVAFYSRCSRTAALLNQRERLEASKRKGCEGYVVNTNVTELLLSETEIFRRLQISSNHSELGKTISFPFTFVLMNHSPDGSRLYVSVLDRSKSGTGAGKKKDAPSNDSSRTFISYKDVDPKTLSEILTEYEGLKADVKKEILREANEMKSRKEEGAKSISGDVCLHQGDEESASAKKQSVEKCLEEQFQNLVAALESYIDPLFSQLQQSLGSDVYPENIVILADTMLMKFPLEALSIFQQKGIKSVTRDFSLQIFYQRFIRGESVGSSESRNERNRSIKKDKGDSKGAKDRPKVDSAAKKPSKDLIFGKDSIFVDLAGFKYILDPHNEIGRDGVSKFDLTHRLDDISQRVRNKGAKWTGVNGSDHIVSEKEIVRVMKDCSSCLVCASAKFNTYINPQTLLGLSLADTHVLFIFDKIETRNGSLNEEKADNSKSSCDLVVESTVERALLLSLSGCCCVVLNQWSDWIDHVQNLAEHFIEGLAQKEQSIGYILHSLYNTAEDDNDSLQSTRDLTSATSSKQGDHARKETASKSRGNQQTSLAGRKLKTAVNNRHEEDAQVKEKKHLFADRLFAMHRFNTVLYGLPSFSGVPTN